MKTNILVETENVKRANKMISELLSRPKTEQRGLGLIYGPPGYGKTRYAEKTAFSNNWGYLRINATYTPKSFLQAIYQRLNWLINSDESIISGFTSTLENLCIEMFQSNPELVIMIDEINLMIMEKKWDVLEIIRDFIDKSFATIILVGEEDTKKRLKVYNPHYFDRCAFFYKFTKNTKTDLMNIYKNLSNINSSFFLYAFICKRGACRENYKACEKIG